MKIIVFLVLFCFLASAQNNMPEYHSLSRKEKNEYKAAVEALMYAMKNEDYSNYVKFAEGILLKYQSVVVDPNCEKLKPSYIMIQKTVEEIRVRIHADSLGQRVSLSENKKNLREALKVNEMLILFLQDNKRDSLANVALKKNESLKEKLYAAEGVSKAYPFIQGLAFKTKNDEKYKKIIEEEQREAFVNVMGSLDVDSVAAFMKRYPGIYEADMKNIFNKSKDKLKVSVMRNPTKINLEAYLRYFPEKDKVIEAAYEDALYQEFKSSPSIMNAQNYLVYYPEGKYKNDVKGFLSGMNTAIIYDSTNTEKR